MRDPTRLSVIWLFVLIVFLPVLSLAQDPSPGEIQSPKMGSEGPKALIKSPDFCPDIIPFWCPSDGRMFPDRCNLVDWCPVCGCRLCRSLVGEAQRRCSAPTCRDVTESDKHDPTICGKSAGVSCKDVGGFWKQHDGCSVPDSVGGIPTDPAPAVINAIFEQACNIHDLSYLVLEDPSRHHTKFDADLRFWANMEALCLDYSSLPIPPPYNVLGLVGCYYLASGCYAAVVFEGDDAYRMNQGYGRTFCTNQACVPDTVPPQIVVSLDRQTLWPPNHKMVDITAQVHVADACDPNPTFVLTSIICNEPDDSLGDGHTRNDIQGAAVETPDTTFQLRAERAGGGNGREYTVIYTASDASGNAAQASVVVSVPHGDPSEALAGNGLAIDGFMPGADHFDLVVPSTGWGDPLVPTAEWPQPSGGYLAFLIDVTKAYVGNAVGVVRPSNARVLDANKDGIPDLVLSYPVPAVQAIQARSTGKDGSIGLNYRMNDGSYRLAGDIFALGTPLDTGANAGTNGSGDSGRAGHVPDLEQASARAAITGVYPNPFTPATTIAFQLRQEQDVSVQVYDIMGRRIATLIEERLPGGPHEIQWDGRSTSGVRVASGIYIIRLSGEGVDVRRKVVLSK